MVKSQRQKINLIRNKTVFSIVLVGMICIIFGCFVRL
mgnify:CR=1 FL=1